MHPACAAASANLLLCVHPAGAPALLTCSCSCHSTLPCLPLPAPPLHNQPGFLPPSSPWPLPFPLIPCLIHSRLSVRVYASLCFRRNSGPSNKLLLLTLCVLSRAFGSSSYSERNIEFLLGFFFSLLYFLSPPLYDCFLYLRVRGFFFRS
ncbi:hypothetical protein SKAU_G00411290, partial [Synaphobranchus kaupii]